MISDWKQVVRTSIAALAPEGRLHIVDFGDFENLVWPIGPLLRAWLGLFHVRPREDLLKTLEKHLDSHGGLALLSGRYAFLLSCGRNDAMASPLWSVA